MLSPHAQFNTKLKMLREHYRKEREALIGRKFSASISTEDLQVQAEQAEHTLKILSLYDAKAECSQGDWHYGFAGERTRKEIEAEFQKHLDDVKKAKGEDDEMCPCGCGMTKAECPGKAKAEQEGSIEVADAIDKVASAEADLQASGLDSPEVKNALYQLDAAKSELMKLVGGT